MSEEWVYTTRRQMLLDERAALSKALESAYSALNGLISGEIQSYNLGHWSITRTKNDLDKLQKWMNDARTRINEIDNILTGRSARNVSTCVYQNPQLTRWW